MNRGIVKKIGRLVHYMVHRFLPKPLPSTVCFGFQQGVKLTKVEFECQKEVFDVTRTCIIWSLNPLLFAIPLSNQFNAKSDFYMNSISELRFFSLVQSKVNLLGKIELLIEKERTLNRNKFLVVSAVATHDYTASRGRLVFDNYLNKVRDRNDLKNFYMSYKDLQAFCLFYSSPRQVVIVSVSSNGRDNLFPMDLISPLNKENKNMLFSLALRKTSPAINLMLESEKIVIGSIPISKSALVFQLGKHHKEENIDWKKLAINYIYSKNYGFKVPEWSNNIKELSIEHSFEEGSHRVFLCSIVSESAEDDYDKMHHVSGRHMNFLSKHKQLEK